MSFEEWERGVSQHLRDDPLWGLRLYRMALYAGDQGRSDCAALAERKDFASLADQLRRAIESVSANIAEGFSRFSPRDRGKFFEYALGSAREARDWYHKARGALGEPVVETRLELLGHIIRITTTLISKARTRGS